MRRPNAYRTTFFDAYPDLEGHVVVHHAVEQQTLTRFPGVVTESEINSLENLRGIPNDVNADVHLSTIRTEWNQFTGNSQPNKEELLQKATEIDLRYGGSGQPSEEDSSEVFLLEPEVAGGLGKNTVIDQGVRSAPRHEPSYEFDGWLGDELLETFPSFIVTQRLAKRIVDAGLTGLELGAVEVSVSQQFQGALWRSQSPRIHVA